jgi:hypothetical protein
MEDRPPTRSGQASPPLSSVPSSRRRRGKAPDTASQRLQWTPSAQVQGSHPLHSTLSASSEAPTYAQAAHPNYVLRKHTNPGLNPGQSQGHAPPQVGQDQMMVDSVAEQTPPVPSTRSVQSSGNPYFNEADIGDHPPLSGASLHQIFRKLKATPEFLPPGKVLKSFQVNTIRLGVREQELLTVGIVLFTPGFNPLLDLIDEWARTKLAQQLNIGIRQVKLLGNSTFLIVLDSAASRATVLATTSISIDSKYVLIVPYTADLDVQALQYKNTAVWVDIIDLDPVLEVEANRMLATIGPVLHSTVRGARSRFRNI